MARVIVSGSKSREVAVIRHESCDALVELVREDVKPDSRDGAYVVCPSCQKPPFISAVLLVWVK